MSVLILQILIFVFFCVAAACVLKSVINVLKTLTVQQMESG